MGSLTVEMLSQPLGVAVVSMIWLAGILTNAIRRARKSNLSLQSYFSTNLGYTVVSVLVSVAAFLMLYINKETSGFEYFSVGYIADSFINKAEAQQESQE